VRIDVYCVRLSPFKTYVEEMVKRLREALAASLRKRVRVCEGLLLQTSHRQQHTLGL
jgi:hypothetical protein